MVHVSAGIFIKIYHNGVPAHCTLSLIFWVFTTRCPPVRDGDEKVKPFQQCIPIVPFHRLKPQTLVESHGNYLTYHHTMLLLVLIPNFFG